MSQSAAPGINAQRLEVDRTREQLENTLAQIEERLDPARAVQFAKRQWKHRPAVVVSTGIAVVGAVALLVAKSVSRG